MLVSLSLSYLSSLPIFLGSAKVSWGLFLFLPLYQSLSQVLLHILSHLFLITNLWDRFISFPFLVVKKNLFLTLFTTLLSPNTWRFSPHQQILQLPGHRFNSDTNYSELGQTPQVEGSVPQNCPQLQTPVINSESPSYPWPHLRLFNNLLYGSQNSGKHLLIFPGL